METSQLNELIKEYDRRRAKSRKLKLFLLAFFLLAMIVCLIFRGPSLYSFLFFVSAIAAGVVAILLGKNMNRYGFIPVISVILFALLLYAVIPQRRAEVLIVRGEESHEIVWHWCSKPYQPGGDEPYASAEKLDPHRFYVDLRAEMTLCHYRVEYSRNPLSGSPNKGERKFHGQRFFSLDNKPDYVMKDPPYSIRVEKKDSDRKIVWVLSPKSSD